MPHDHPTLLTAFSLLACTAFVAAQNASTSGTCNDLPFDYDFDSSRCELRISLHGAGAFEFSSPLWSRKRCDGSRSTRSRKSRA